MNYLTLAKRNNKKLQCQSPFFNGKLIDQANEDISIQ